MKNRYGIGFFAAAAVAVLAVTGAYELSYQKAKQDALEEQQIKEQELVKSQERSVAADGNALKEDCYYLMEVNGYVVVYLSDKKTPYEYTNIQFDTLPEKLREEVRNGKYVESAQELYGFLENYSS